MDPTENLKRQRELAAEIIDIDLPDEAVANLGAELAELVQALDEWITSGGYLPGDWASAVIGRVTKRYDQLMTWERLLGQGTRRARGPSDGRLGSP